MPFWILLLVVLLPTVLALLIVAFAPSRADAVIQVLRETKTSGRLLEVLTQMLRRNCSCHQQVASLDRGRDDPR